MRDLAWNYFGCLRNRVTSRNHPAVLARQHWVSSQRIHRPWGRGCSCNGLCRHLASLDCLSIFLRDEGHRHVVIPIVKLRSSFLVTSLPTAPAVSVSIGIPRLRCFVLSEQRS
jgi:hypothetical protein